MQAPPPTDEDERLEAQPFQSQKMETAGKLVGAFAHKLREVPGRPVAPNQAAFPNILPKEPNTPAH